MPTQTVWIWMFTPLLCLCSSIFPKDTLACRLEQPGFEPPAFQLVDDLLYLLGRKSLIFTRVFFSVICLQRLVRTIQWVYKKIHMNWKVRVSVRVRVCQWWWFIPQRVNSYLWVKCACVTSLVTLLVVLPRAKNASGRDEPSYELLKLIEIISF